MKYQVTARHITAPSQRRSGQRLNPGVKFVVAHDTGNPGSTASGNVGYYQDSRNKMYASAHLFVDDRDLLECIPAVTTDAPEKAWHVHYNLTTDNVRYGHHANDTAIAVEYCYGPSINADQAYARYVWVLAYICYKYQLDPATAIVGHFVLDPARRRDPVSGLAASGRTYEKLLTDVVTEYQACTGAAPSPTPTPTNNTIIPMQLIKNTSSNKVYAIGQDNKKHWIFNMETFVAGQEAGLWGDASSIQTVNDDQYAEGHAIVLVKS